MAQRAKTTGKAAQPRGIAKENDLAEFERFLKRHPKTQFVDAFISDLCSTIRGKRLPIHEAAKIWQSGVQMPFCLYFLDVTGEEKK